jgi:hypothetical protein
MSKPDWKDAPKWANWLAMDGDGQWWWYEDEPKLEDDIYDSLGRVQRAWLKSHLSPTLERRP